MELNIQSALPDNSIAHFVHSFWMLENKTGKDITTTILPNGMIDMTVMKMNGTGWQMFLRGIDTKPGQVIITADAKIVTVGFKLLAAEYLFRDAIKGVLNESKLFADEYWQFEEGDLQQMENFKAKATQKIKTVLTGDIDSRKEKLFELIYSSQGSMPVKALSEKVYWSSRQINRYFNEQFGLSLKTYCTILRLGASFKHISEGKLFPQQNFTDQNHFIKEIKKYAGLTPKELSKNKDDRFIDITAIKKFPS